MKLSKQQLLVLHQLFEAMGKAHEELENAVTEYNHQVATASDGDV